MDKRWVLKTQGDTDVVNRLAAELRINKILVNLMVQRGITTYDEAKRFFRPSLEDLHDPFLMKDMDKAIARIGEALASKEHILIYGDYDVDGTTAVSLVYTFLKGYSGNVFYYIPDRYKEGYGISRQGIDWAKENKYSLIIALDCGIKSIDKVAYAKELGFSWRTVPQDRQPQMQVVNRLFSNFIPQLVVTDQAGNVVIDSATVGGPQNALKRFDALLKKS